MEYVLILAMWAGVLASTDSTAMTNVPGFVDEEFCKTAGKAAVKEFSTMYKTVKFVCMPMSRYREFKSE